VPIRPGLVKLLRDHIAKFGCQPAGRIFSPFNAALGSYLDNIVVYAHLTGVVPG
jgi:hypothetical protein